MKSEGNNNNNRLWPFVRDYPGESVPEETFTYTYPDHQPSFISFLNLLWFIASSLFNLCGWQSFLHHLSPGPVWSTSWSW